jgi:hypothetical protein
MAYWQVRESDIKANRSAVSQRDRTDHGNGDATGQAREDVTTDARRAA